ncbi:MAG: alpha/beta hydrolase family protein [Alphaproteobacteria bacterium]
MASADFDAEIFDYWIPRLVADGVDANDVQAVRPHVGNWDDWPGAWADVADRHLELAETRRANGSSVTAGEAFVRASLCYHVGQVVAGHMPDVKRDLQKRKEAAFRDGAPLLLPPAERIVIDHDGVPLPGYLRMPVNADRPMPCVILVPGLDSTKEDFITLSEMCVRRGMASFAYDGPGQGEVRQHALLADGYEASILAVFAAIADRPEIDAARIGLLGRSLGGFYILRAAAAEPRIGALAVFGGTYDFGDWDNMPKTILDGFLWTTDSETYDDARAKMGAGTVGDCIDRVACPTIVVHGKLDGIFHYSQAERIAAALGDKAELHIAETGVHCCHNFGFRYRTLMVDWMAQTL